MTPLPLILISINYLLLSYITEGDAKGVMQGGHSLINIASVSTRSVEACCNEEHLLECTEVTIDPSLLLSGEDINILGTDLVFDSTVEPHGFVYHNSQGDEAVITYNNKTGNMFGSLKTHDDKSYAIEKCHHGYFIKEYDMASFENDQMERSFDPVIEMVEDRADDTTTVVTYSIMFYYTQEFEDTTADIDGFIEQVLAETNQGYINSQIPLRASKLCAEKANIEEGDDKVLTRFRNMKQGSSSKLRNSADAAALLVQNFAYCGQATLSTYNTGDTVSVTMKSCALGYYSFGHEIAHNLGALHDPRVSTNSIFPEGHGHLIAQGSGTNSRGYRTIMGYNADGHGHRVNYYSNPNVILPDTGTPTGVAGTSNNAAVLTRNRFMMAALGDESASCLLECGNIVKVLGSRLEGVGKAYPEVMGLYDKQPGLVNGKAWYQSLNGYAIFLAGNGNWHITSKKNIGTTVSRIWKSGQAKCPHDQDNNWKYWNWNGKWKVMEDLTLRVDSVQPGFIITGGDPASSQKKVELFNPASGNSCPVQDMQVARFAQTSCSGLVCGGFPTSARRSCGKITGTDVSPLPSVTLKQIRFGHVCWKLPGEDKILLIGGWESPKTTEIVSESSSSDSFNLPYVTRHACGIEVGEHLVVTGGGNWYATNWAVDTVAKYSKSGFLEYMASLNQRRYLHACSSYISDSGETVLLVTGGVHYPGRTATRLDSTEILETPGGSWRILSTARLPSLRSDLRAGTVNNVIFLFGGKDASSRLNTILSFDKTEESWQPAGQMTVERSEAAVEVIDDVSQLCP